MAENCTATLHNLYTPRGAQVRDALAWSRYIERVDRAVRRRSRRRVREPPLAALGRATTSRHYLEQAARPVPLPPRPDACGCANHGLTMLEIAEELRAAAEPRRRVLQPRLLRHRQPQREGGLPALPRLVRRQPGATCTRSAGRGRRALRRATWAAPTRCSRRRATSSREGDYRWVAAGRQPPGVRRPGQRRRARRCRPTRSSSSATRPSPGRGATST